MRQETFVTSEASIASPLDRGMSVVQFRACLERWLADFEADWTARNAADPELFPGAAPIEELWADFAELVECNALRVSDRAR